MYRNDIFRSIRNYGIGLCQEVVEKMNSKNIPVNKRIILDLCGGTGQWSKPYNDSGYDVRLITLPQLDVFKYIPPSDIYGILAAPTCTHFSLARTTAATPRDLREAFKLVHRCLEIIWECQYNEKTRLKFWAMENPRALLRMFLGKPPLTFDPCDFGDPYTKQTDLWGYYNAPKYCKVNLTDQKMRDCSINNRILPKVPDDYIVPEGMRVQAVRRSMTPKGFAQAFFEANR
jgi:hypothetical protein